jgi:general secretion pathway protein K
VIALAAGRAQRGAALLLALVVTAIAAGIAASMLFHGELQISRTLQLTRQSQAWQLAAGMEDWAFTILDRDREVTPLWDSFDDPWSLPLPPTPVPGGEVSGELLDLSGRFNLNSLLDPATGTETPLAVRRFRRLVVEVLGLDAAIVDQVLDLMDRDTVPRPMGLESGTGDGFVRHESMLRDLPAVSAAAAAALLPLVTALPPGAVINVNTAPPQVLMALAPGIDAGLALRARPPRGRPWESVAAFSGQAALEGITVEAEGLGVRSTGFLARARIAFDDTVLEFHSVIIRGGARADSSYHVRNRGMSAP